MIRTTITIIIFHCSDSKNDGVDSAKKEEEKGLMKIMSCWIIFRFFSELARENYRLKHEIAELRSKEDKLNSFIKSVSVQIKNRLPIIIYPH